MARSTICLMEVDQLVLLRIANFLRPEDVTRLSLTCKYLRALLPRFSAITMKGRDFVNVPGSGTGWGDCERYFDGPRLRGIVKRLTVSVKSWNDQGWGNRKGELFVQLVRGEEIVAERRELFGIAAHSEKSGEIELLRSEKVVSNAQPADRYRFMRRVGGGGGHTLTVRGFKALAILQI